MRQAEVVKSLVRGRHIAKQRTTATPHTSRAFNPDKWRHPESNTAIILTLSASISPILLHSGGNSIHRKSSVTNLAAGTSESDDGKNYVT